MDSTEGKEFVARFLNLLETNKNGVSEKTLQSVSDSVSTKIRAECTNKLLAGGKIELLKKGGQLIYKLKNEDQRLETDEETVIYNIIEEAGNIGIWMRDIRLKSKIPQIQLSKLCKSMESKKLIKSVKSIAANKKKVYMLYNVQPDDSVTGGTWYSNNDFESEFVEILNSQCFKYLLRKAEIARSYSSPIERKKSSFVSSYEVLDYINETGISRVTLSKKDIEAILETLVFDGKVERTVSNDSSSSDTSDKMYRAINRTTTTTSLMRMPCGVCPVAKDCHLDGVISPIKCIYFNDFFEI
ncbi:DNA-directed RNA polymerase III subunit RPC6 [Tetranychus urticae]|uniref:DNA-directed RNA polymerase III subunit RPC6 n=1 Tax=Tetranychus urticae TaxID=32264 RepID=T1K5G8_TETUR|nr:DNA-directed RNA polymerase III subunit RPC6 [Tetranychus urticae]